MKTPFFLLPLFALVSSALCAPVDDAETLLQRQQYKEAAAALPDSALAAAPEKGYARYLRAVALAESKQFAAAITDCDAVPAADLWYRKALFLKAQCLAELKRHQEAEAIYSAESARIFATARTENLAEALVGLARELTKPAVPGQTVSAEAQQKALSLYRKALELESGVTSRESLLFETVNLLRVLHRTGEVPAAAEAYLREFDPDWIAGSAVEKSPAKEAGKHRWEVRALLIENALLTGARARTVGLAEDLLTLWKAKPLPAGAHPDAGDIEWMICRAYGPLASVQFSLSNIDTVPQVAAPNAAPQITRQQRLQLAAQAQVQAIQQIDTAPQVAAGTLNPGDPVKYVESIRAFLKRFPNHPRSAEAAWALVQALVAQSKIEDAIAACQAVYDRADWPAPAPAEGDNRPPAERLEGWRQEAFFKHGELRFALRQYPQAIEQWRAYITRHPDGSLWQKAQASILDAEFQLCLESVAAGNRAEATKRFDAFIAAHPLDPRCAQLLFLNGQWPYAAAQAQEKAAAGKPRTKEHLALYESAMTEWARLIGKHPQSHEASLALYRTGVIQADILGRYEEALATFQRLNWGAWQPLAAERAAMMPQKSLALQTPRTFRTNEPAVVRVNTRNLEKLKVSRYTLNLEDYFRGRHRLDGANGIGSLDIDLIQPDKTWEVPVEGFARLKPIEQDIPIPFDAAKPGVCIVRVESDDWQASTIVNRSDIDIIVQSVWTEALVLVQDRVKGAVVANADVLISNGKEIIGQGRTGADGVFRLRGEMIRSAADLCVYVRTPAGEAIQQLSLRGMTQEITDGESDRESVTPSRRGFIYTDKFTYRPGETLHFRGIIRDVKDGAYLVPAGREYEVRVQDGQRRLLQKTKVKLSEFGTFTQSAPLPAELPLGEYRIAVRSVEGDEAYSAEFQVRQFSVDEIAIAFETKPEAVYRGDRIEGAVRLRYSWGAALADEPVTLQMPDGRKLEGKTNADGLFAFTQETTGFQPGQYIAFSALLPARGRTASHSVSILKAGVQLVWERVPSPALAGQPALLRFKALTPAGKPTAATVKLTIARKPEQKPNDILGGLPGLRYIPAIAAPAKVEEFTVQTDATTGLAEARPVLKDAAPHVITASTADARGNAVEITANVAVSGPDDPQKLLLFSEADEVLEGATIQVDAHSRLAAPLALVTFAGEAIVEHRIVPLVAGHNALSATVGAAHWPQFDVSVACLDGDKLHRVRRGFIVKRPLKIEIATPAQPPKPGDPFEITLTAKDGLDKPVAAELSLALASAQLFAQFPDGCSSTIEDYFATNLRRRGSVRTTSNAGFNHRGQSRLLERDPSGNAAGAAKPTASHLDRAANLQAAELRTWNERRAVISSGEDPGLQFSQQEFQSLFANGGAPDSERRSGGAVFARSSNLHGFPIDVEQTIAPNSDYGFHGINQMPPGTPLGSKPFAPQAQWHCPIVTDATGKATVKLLAPSVAGAWRLMSKGITVATQSGQAEKILVTKAPFSFDLTAPTLARPGDSFAPQVTAFSSPGEKLAATLSLEFRAPPPAPGTKSKVVTHQEASIAPAPGESVATRFARFTVPQLAGGYSLVLDATTAIGSELRTEAALEVLPSDDPVSQPSAQIFDAPGALNLPAQDRKSTLFTLHDSPLALLDAMGFGQSDALDRQARTPQTAASRLLGAVSALRATRAAGKEEALLAEHVRRLVATLQITQREGGWTWQDVHWDRDSVVSSVGLWALVEARALGFEVEDTTVNSAATYLKSALAIIPPDEPEKAAVILHALAMVNQADFSVANRLLRDRAKLNDPALAWLAAAFLRMERAPEAQELLKALEARPSWTGSQSTARLSRNDDTTAMVLYAAARAQAGSPLANRAAQALLAQLGITCGADSPLRGLWTAALAEHFIGTGKHKIDAPANLALSINGAAIQRSTPPAYAAPFTVPAGNAAIRADVSFTGQGSPILLASSIVARANAAADTTALPSLTARQWLHAGLRHRDLPLKSASTSPVSTATFGQRIHVALVLKAPQKPQTGYVLLEEPLPAGCALIAGTLSAPTSLLEELPGRLRLWFNPGTFKEGKTTVLSYDLVALHPGAFSIPATVISDASRTDRRLTGPAGKLTVLLPGEPGPNPYQMNRAERLELATLLFNEGKLEDARTHLELLRADPVAMKASEREIARMLLWAQTARNPMDAKQVVELFEALSERHPDLVIPFDRILKVAEAYRLIGEFERGWLVHRATMEGAFVRDAGVSAALEAAGDFPGSVDFLLALWREFPDAPDVSLAFFRLAQSLQEKSTEPAAVPVRPGAVKPTKTQLLERSRNLLRTFVTLRAKDDLADDASFNLANVYFDLKDYASVVKTAGIAAAAYPKSPFANSFHYMMALGHFWQYQFPQALAAAAPVAAGASEDAPNARYITAQIYHAQERHADAILWYEKVKDEFNDAEESLKTLQEKGVKLPPATSAKPGEPVKLELGYRNVKEAALKIYRVDLLKLHERQKDSDIVSGVNLSGITPEAEITVPLGNGLDYAWKKRTLELPMKNEGAYLVICRGDSQMTSALVLITTLALEVNEDPESGSVRVQLRDTAKGSYVADAEIAAYDSAGVAQPQKGRTDPRGAFGASGIQGLATVVVKLGDTRYAYYRSPSTLRPLLAVKTPPGLPNANAPAQPAQQAVQKPMSKSDYLMNVKEQVDQNALGNKALWESKMKAGGEGVKAEKAFKK